jgi:hypothetical protein
MDPEEESVGNPQEQREGPATIQDGGIFPVSGQTDPLFSPGREPRCQLERIATVMWGWEWGSGSGHSEVVFETGKNCFSGTV